MYQKAFDQYLKQALPYVVLLYSDHDYLIEHYIDTYIIRSQRVYTFTLP